MCALCKGLVVPMPNLPSMFRLLLNVIIPLDVRSNLLVSTFDADDIILKSPL